jgi:hypothetical protein
MNQNLYYRARNIQASQILPAVALDVQVSQFLPLKIAGEIGSLES